jgi:chorismate mutase
VSILYDELLYANRLNESGIVSVVFSVTGDLNAANPCSALRKSGRAGELALFSCLEPDVQGSLERTCRILIHCYLEEETKPRHVYRNGAEILRPDIT